MHRTSRRLLTVLFASLLSVCLAVTLSGCDFFESDEDSSNTGTSSVGSSSGDAFVIAPGVYKEIQVTLPATLKFTLTTGPVLDNFHSENRAFIIVGKGTDDGVNGGFLEFRTYKVKLGDQQENYPGGEPRFAPTISWQPNTSYAIELTQTTSGADCKINDQAVYVGGSVSPRQTYTIGGQPGWYSRPSLNGCTISGIEFTSK